MSKSERELQLERRVQQLESEITKLRQAPGAAESSYWTANSATVRVPDAMRPMFDQAQETVKAYFSDVIIDPTKATIKINNDRYVLMRASSLSVDFLKTIKNLYADRGEEEAIAIGHNFLFDISHVIGMEDAGNFHQKMGLTDPIARLSTGPVHFAYCGWAFVEIADESAPSPDENFFIKYNHPFSFEADAWLNAGQKSSNPVCIMNAGYSSGWCQESFGVELTAVEIACKAAGDEHCTFIMAPPHKIREHLKRYVPDQQHSRVSTSRIPTFFERKRVEEEMNAARKKAEDSDRMKSEFLTNMSHEIRTPMNALIGMTELVLDSELTATQRDYLTTSLESAESLMAIINQILDFSKIGSGKLKLEKIAFSLREFIHNTVKPLLVRARDKGIQLSALVNEDVPDNFRGDATRLRQILVNLIGNAIKFTEQGEVKTTIALEQDVNNKCILHFSVRDTGVGIPKNKLDSVFEAFTQVDMSNTRQFGGTGLGLTISAKLVELMNGNIWVEQNPTSGSTFHFTVQLDKGMATIHDPLLAGQPVLVVADNPQHLKIIGNVFRKYRMNVVTADSAHAALTILMDRSLPGHQSQLLISDMDDHLILLESIRSRPEINSTAVIALLNSADPSVIKQLENLEVNAFLNKPIKQSKLVATVKNTIQMQSNESESRKVSNDAPGPSPSASDSSLAIENSIRILLVEDGLANQKFAQAMLTRWDHEVVIANHGREALDILENGEQQFDLILMDVLMPVMDGLEATAAIREREKTTGGHIPIVAITAQAMKGDREKCLASGMDEYLTKPIRRRELQQVIKHVLG